jgi:mannose-P-dolichol utilization defect 1
MPPHAPVIFGFLFQAILIQNIALLFLIYRYQRRSSGRTIVFVVALVSWAALVTSGALRPSHLAAMYDLNNIILLASRVPQIAQNFAAKSTGQLSFVTYFLNTAGSAARIFTTLQEKNAGAAMLRGAMLSEFWIQGCCL